MEYGNGSGGRGRGVASRARVRAITRESFFFFVSPARAKGIVQSLQSLRKNGILGAKNGETCTLANLAEKYDMRERAGLFVRAHGRRVVFDVVFGTGYASGEAECQRKHNGQHDEEQAERTHAEARGFRVFFHVSGVQPHSLHDVGQVLNLLVQLVIFFFERVEPSNHLRKLFVVHSTQDSTEKHRKTQEIFLPSNTEKALAGTHPTYLET